MPAIVASFTEGGRQYTYLTDNVDFEIGDFAVVPASGTYEYPKVVRVEQVDLTFETPMPAPYQYKKVIARIPFAAVKEATNATF